VLNVISCRLRVAWRSLRSTWNAVTQRPKSPKRNNLFVLFYDIAGVTSTVWYTVAVCPRKSVLLNAGLLRSSHYTSQAQTHGYLSGRITLPLLLGRYRASVLICGRQITPTEKQFTANKNLQQQDTIQKSAGSECFEAVCD